MSKLEISITLSRDAINAILNSMQPANATQRQIKAMKALKKLLTPVR